MKINSLNIYFESLGCARNFVDSEVMMGQLKKAGAVMMDDPEDADTIIINTCSFIEDAVNESIDTILHLAQYKKTGKCGRLIVVGCLPERFREDIVKSLPEVDLFLGTGALDQVVRAVENISDIKRCSLPDPDQLSLTGYKTRYRIEPDKPYAYLKIAEGCDKHCTYCIIPKLRGRQKSRPIRDIVDEATILIENGTKELVLVAQETSFYGKDLHPPADIAELLEKLSRLSDDIWIRMLYGHPESLNEKLIKTIATHKNICSYFDIPIQHAGNPVLRRMGRKYTQESLFQRIENIRSHIPDAALRTTVIVGFPGETDEDFQTLKNFVEAVRFDHLGAFIYSDSEDLPSHRLKNHVRPSVARKRYDTIMAVQRGISMDKNAGYVGKTVSVLVEDMPEKNVFIGRTVFQAPEVDGITYIKCNGAPMGNFMDVTISDALEYDLVGEPE